MSAATLPPATALLAGTTNLTVSFNAIGNFTLTATDLSNGSKTPGTSPAIAVSPAQFTPATGGAPFRLTPRRHLHQFDRTDLLGKCQRQCRHRHDHP